MVTEFEAINKALKLSKTEFSNEVMVVFKRQDGSFGILIESAYWGDEENICGKYLNGGLVPA